MKLARLLSSLHIGIGTIPDMEITGIQEDSRRIAPGNLFIAKPGVTTDGAKYLADAAQNGAAAAVVGEVAHQVALPQIVVPDPAAAISVLADCFYEHPSKAVKVIGITGTNGKTTTTYLIQHLLRSIGSRCGLIGTVQIDDGRTAVEATMTTPSPIKVSSLLADMQRNGCAACAIEVSSHALHQNRVGAIQFAAGAFTNLTGDHLDYHKTMEAYADAKAMLFEMLPDAAPAIVNVRDAASARMTRNTRGRVRSYGIDCAADYRATDVHISAAGTRFLLHTPAGAAEISMPLIGLFNVENSLAAAACVAELFGMTAEQIAAGLADAIGAPGRMQQVVAGQPFTVLVDYAHTDDALANVLRALRPLTAGRLRVMFGCGGDRDPSKRPRMARVAQELADAVYLTSDNPRTEEPLAIIEQVSSGFAMPSAVPLTIVPDRREAIARILRDAQAGDVVVLAGKGHENYQIIGTTKQHFDDVEEARRVMQ